MLIPQRRQARRHGFVPCLCLINLLRMERMTLPSRSSGVQRCLVLCRQGRAQRLESFRMRRRQPLGVSRLRCRQCLRVISRHRRYLHT